MRGLALPCNYVQMLRGMVALFSSRHVAGYYIINRGGEGTRRVERLGVRRDGPSSGFHELLAREQHRKARYESRKGSRRLVRIRLSSDRTSGSTLAISRECRSSNGQRSPRRFRGKDDANQQVRERPL